MPNDTIKSGKIVRGSEKQLEYLGQLLQDDDFKNKMVLNACLINEVYRETRKIINKSGKDAGHDYLKALVADNFADLDKKQFFKNPRGMGIFTK